MIDFEKAVNEFMKYSNTYDHGNRKIVSKTDHSLRVMKCSKKIAESLNLNNTEVEIATIIGLLHDIARFEQMKKFGTFSDSKSIDHGNLGVEILEKNNFIRKFIDKNEFDNIIKIAIKNHNKYKIEEGLDERTLLHCKIIRDADKLDIFYEAIEMFWQKEDEIKNIENSYISDSYFEQFLNHIPILRVTNQTPLDAVISLIAFIYDLNFEYSINITYQENYINKILDRFDYKIESSKEQIERIRKVANEYLINK